METGCKRIGNCLKKMETFGNISWKRGCIQNGVWFSDLKFWGLSMHFFSNLSQQIFFETGPQSCGDAKFGLSLSFERIIVQNVIF